VDLRKAIQPPQTAHDGGLVGDDAHKVTGALEFPHRSTSTGQQDKFIGSVDVAFTTHIQHTVTVQKRHGLWNIGSGPGTERMNVRPPHDARSLRATLGVVHP
jgi:hypothetical protein